MQPTLIYRYPIHPLSFHMFIIFNMDKEILDSIERFFGLRVNRDMNPEFTILDSKKSAYMLSNLYTQESIFITFAIIEFWSGINCDEIRTKNIFYGTNCKRRRNYNKSGGGIRLLNSN